MRRVIIIIFILFIVLPSVIFAVTDDEICSGIKSYSIYEVSRAPMQQYYFMGVPGLTDGNYYAEKVTLQYDIWYYGATDDRNSTAGTHEDWDELPTGIYAPHIYKKFSGVVSKHNRDLEWEYRYFLPGGPTTDGFKRYYPECFPSYTSGRYVKLVDWHWQNLPSQTDGMLYIMLGARGYKDHRTSQIDVTYNIYEYSNHYRADNPNNPDLVPKNFETMPGISSVSGGGLNAPVSGVVNGTRFVELLAYNNEYATYETYHYVVYEKVHYWFGDVYFFKGRYPQENDMPVTFYASGKFRVLPPTLNSVSNSNTGLVTVSGTVGEVTAYPQTVRFYVDGVYDSSSTITVPANTSNFSKDFSFEGEGTHAFMARAVGNSGHESRDSNTVSAIVDVIPPEIKNLTVSRNLFSPLSSSVEYTTTTITAKVEDVNPYSWKIEIKSGDTLVREYNYTGTNKNISVVWDGKDTVGNVVASGNYGVYVTAVDAAGNDSTRSVTDNFSYPGPLNKYIWQDGYGGTVDLSTVTLYGVDYPAGSTMSVTMNNELYMRAHSTQMESFGTIFLRSRSKVNTEGGLTIKIPMVAPYNPNGDGQGTATVFSEFYVHSVLLSTGQPPHDYPSYLRAVVRSSGGTFHWILERRRPGDSQPWWYFTSKSAPGNIINSRGIWTINITSAIVATTLELGDGTSYYYTNPNDLDFTSAYLYYAFRTESTTDYIFTSGYLWSSIEPTWTTVAVDSTKPAVVSAVTGISGYYPGYVNLQWTPPGDDGTAGNVSAYETRYNAYNISGDTATWWNNATVLNQNWTSTDNDKIVTGLSPGVTYYFVLRGRDDVWNLSDMPATACSVVASTQNLVYINEVMPSDPSSGDWFELKSEWNKTIKLENWKFYGNTAVKWAGSTETLPGNNFYMGDGISLAKAKSTTFYIENNFGDIVDKIILGEQVDVGSYSRFIYENKILYETDPTPTKGIENTVSNETVKINEIKYRSGSPEPWGDSSKKMYEFIELHNTDDATKPLTGWILRNKSKTPFYLPVFKISPKDFNSVNASSYGHSSSTNIVAGDIPSLSYTNAFKFGTSNGLTNTADFVVFENPAGQTVDRVTWGNPGVYYSSNGVTVALTNPAPVVNNDSYSIGRASDVITGSSYDTDIDGIDFSTRTVPTESSQNANSGLAAANELISPSSSTSLSGSFNATIKLGANSSGYPTDTLTFSVAKDGGNDPYSPHIFQLSNLGFNLTLYGSTQTVAMDSGTTDINGNQLADKVTYYVILNTDMDDSGTRKSAAAITCLNVYYRRVGPAQITDLSATAGTYEGTITLNWTAPGADGTVGTAAEYELRNSTNAIISLDDFFNSARINISNPLSPGSNEQVLVTGLLSNTLYYFRIRTKNDSIWAGLSTSASVVSQKDNINPATITNLIASSDSQVRIIWTAPGDDGTVGVCKSYIVKYSLNPINNDYNFNDPDYTFSYSQSWTPSIAGTTETKYISGFKPKTTYYFAIKAVDDSDNLTVGFSSSSCITGNFYDSQQNITPFGLGSSCAWGDIDNDGLLDLVVVGSSGSVKQAKVYKNSGGNLQFSQDLLPVSNGSVAFGDYDRDGDLDLALIGDSGSGVIMPRIYKNNGSGTFSEDSAAMQNLNFKDIRDGQVSWMDYDNDGDLDVVVTGYSSYNGYISYIYRNDSGIFNYGTSLSGSGAYESSHALGDYNQDGYMDLFVIGYNSSMVKTSKLYRNNGDGTFTSTGNFTNVSDGAVCWADFDGDGDLDLALTGSTTSQYVFEIYSNNPVGTLTKTQDLPGLGDKNRSSIVVGDYDNDGDVDLAVTGFQDKLKIYRNDSGIFNEDTLQFQDIGAAMTDQSFVAFADYDNDKDLDIIFNYAAWPSGETRTKIFKNTEAEFGNANIPPNSPSSMSSVFYSTYTNNILNLIWEIGTSPYNNYYYNVRVGTSLVSGGASNNIVSSVYGSPLLGNYIRPKISTSAVEMGVKLKNLPTDTTYYWQAQIIDPGLLAGDWSYWQVAFTGVPPSAITDFVATQSSSTSSPGDVDLTWTAPGDDGTVGTATKYIVKYKKTTPAGGDYENWWNTATEFVQNWAPLASGSTEFHVITGLITDGSTYYFAIKTADETNTTSVIDSKTSSGQQAAAIPQIDPAAPGAITNLSALSGSIEGQITIIWTAPSEDGTVGGAVSYYDLRYATATFTNSDWTSAWIIQAPNEPASPKNPGEPETMTVTGLIPNTTYWFAMKSKDEANNISAIDTTTPQANAKAQDDVTPPYAITDLVVKPGTSIGEIILQWTSPGDDGTVGNNTSGKYVVKYSSYAEISNESRFESAAEFTNGWIPKNTGQLESRAVTGLTFGVPYWLSVKTKDEKGNTASLSNYQYEATYVSDKVSHIVISEIQTAGATTTDEFVELYNPTTNTINISGWYLTRKTSGGTEYNLVSGFLSTTTVQSRSYLLIAPNGYDGATARDVAYTNASENIASNNTVILYSDSKLTVVDKVGFGTAADKEEIATSNPATDGSIERKANAGSTSVTMGSGGADEFLGNGYDTNHNSNNFVTRAVSQPQNSTSANEPLDTTAPSQVSDLVASEGGVGGEVSLVWTAVGDDGTVGTASYYVVKFATFNAASVGGTTIWFNLAGTAPSFAPQPPGYQDGCVVTGLAEGVTYYFALKVGDEANNLSSVSNESFSIPMTYRSLVFNEIAPSQDNGKDIIEFFVAKAGNYGGYKVYENANSTGTELVKTFPTTGIWSGEIPIGTYILLHFSTGTADETGITNNVINLYTSDSGLDATDNLLYLSDSGGIVFSNGVYQSGKIIDFVAYANQDLTELSGTYQTNIATATQKGQWEYAAALPKQFDCVNSRGLTQSGRALARDESSEKYGYKGDWSYRTSLSTGVVNPPSTTAGGLGTATIYQSSSVVVNSTGTWKIEYKVSDPTYSNDGHIITIDIPSGWTVPQTTDPYSAGYTTTTFSFPSGYGLSVITGIEGVAGRIMFPVGQLTAGATVSIIYGDTTTSANGCAMVQSSSGTAMFAVSSDDTGTNIAELIAGSPGLQVTGGGGYGAPRRVGLNTDFVKGEIYSFPNPAKRGRRPTIHIECGVADKVEIRIYNIAAELVHSAELYDMPSVVRGKYAYEYTWDISDIASGVYIYTIRAKKSGYSDIKATGKCAIIK